MKSQHGPAHAEPADAPDTHKTSRWITPLLYVPFFCFPFPNPNTERKEACREETGPRRQAFQQLRRQLSCTDRARPCTGKTDDEPDEDHCSRQMYRERLTLYQKMPQPGAADRTPGQRERPLQKNAGKRLEKPETFERWKQHAI